MKHNKKRNTAFLYESLIKELTRSIIKGRSLIKDMRESLSNAVFSNFISNYRDMASIGQFFNSTDTTAKQRLLLESKVVNMVLKAKPESKEIKHVDNLTYKTFINKFNATYDNVLREEQKKLLTNYITSFSNNGLGLKSFMNEEIGRLKERLVESLEGPIDKPDYKKHTKRVIEKLDSFSHKPIDEEMVKDLFFMQDLVYEVSKR
jgi:hypothetical protein